VKKILIGAGAILVVIIVAITLFSMRYRTMVQRIEEENIESIRLESVEDGVYNGSFAEFLVSIDLNVTIKDHRITEIEVVEQSAGPGYEATETLDRIKAAQSPRVDAVSGATGSSKAIMIAVSNALKKASRK
jgi:uncharacterized protein with FMN-binding domain